MSFSMNYNGHFPRLGSKNQILPVPKEINHKQHLTDYTDIDFVKTVFEKPYCEHAEWYQVCKVGIRLNEFHENLAESLKKFDIGNQFDFLVTPIEPIRNAAEPYKFEPISDLALQTDCWAYNIVVDLHYETFQPGPIEAAKHFDEILSHAMYLPSRTITINSPCVEHHSLAIASTVNSRLDMCRKNTSLLFRVPMTSDSTSPPSQVHTSPSRGSDDSQTISSSCDGRIVNTTDRHDWGNDSQNWSIQEDFQASGAWSQWNSLRAHLIPDKRIGVCLMVTDDIVSDVEEIKKWLGEPVKMVVIGIDQFLGSSNPQLGLRLTSRCRNFLSALYEANSRKMAFVLDYTRPIDVEDFAKFLYHLENGLNSIPNPLLDWGEVLQQPLQPLSSNLESSVYHVFETDDKKYIAYYSAMVEALDCLLQDKKPSQRRFHLMVLGAGRGPLVDRFIQAIKEANKGRKFLFKLFALDKNPSSVRALLHKHNTIWKDDTNTIVTEVIESDMRAWRPGIKADIIASELLGSLGDNELSPECIDGVWKIATSKTLSIPQSYCSYIAPISCYRLYQKLHENTIEPCPYDQVYVVKYTNNYEIDKPKALFKFEHKDLSISPDQRCNERYTKLEFFSKTDTMCHGFAGYFTAHLFGRVSISTLPEELKKERDPMQSWFPVYIPLESPIFLARNSKLVIHFWRKEDSKQVWYEWTVTHPHRSRIHRQTPMSKQI